MKLYACKSISYKSSVKNYISIAVISSKHSYLLAKLTRMQKVGKIIL
ncbi:hypothetical protein A1OE_1090 [Candidatus Endolissoclinum faulkneri L2]|uniref:Uncharacterized protein n=1 Tax=Candidatus Endolissoclinum faulkneri L2 TaxID=1193729 RepID=K7Z5E1_9PROT|nr:hypothetical protein A1OE_1090 [Candidatus Endolissoclinum faulkneri L2]